MTGPSHDKDIEQAKRIMAALVRQPPKTHDEMKVGKGKPTKRVLNMPPKPREKPAGDDKIKVGKSPGEKGRVPRKDGH
jgi:hypothetical protein